MLPLVEKADSDATIDIGTANTSFAILKRILNLPELIFHQPNTSKFSNNTSSHALAK